MSDTTVTIASDGTPTPSDVSAAPGGTVSFHADGADVVLCVHPPTVFGEERYAIPAGETRDLTVQPDASGAFEFVARTGDLDAPCRGGRDKEVGGRGGIG